jgi:hypothetical protein
MLKRAGKRRGFSPEIWRHMGPNPSLTSSIERLGSLSKAPISFPGRQSGSPRVGTK